MSSRRRTSSNAHDDDILQETRRLLNALNEENAELKNQNNLLSDKVRRASDAFAAVTEEKDALEQDMKQINLNLMQQLKAKSNALRDAEAALERSEERHRGSQGDGQKAERVKAELETEIVVCRERLAVLEDHNRKLLKRIEELTTNAEDSRTQSKLLQDEARRARDETARHSTEWVREKQNLVAQLESQRSSAAAREEEHAAVVEAFTRQVALLSVEARRFETAESEAAFVHDQMATMSQLIGEQLALLQKDVRGALVHVAECDATLAGELDRARMLSTALGTHKQHEEALIHYLMSEKRLLESELAAKESALSRAKDELKGFQDTCSGSANELAALRSAVAKAQDEATNAGRLYEAATAEVRRLGDVNRALEERVDAAERSLDKMRKSLAEADAALAISGDANHRLEVDLARERAERSGLAEAHRVELDRINTAFQAERLRFDEDRAALDDEIDSLQQQLREHTETLAHALSRVSHAQASRRSVSHRSVSVDGSVVSNIGAYRTRAADVVKDDFTLRAAPPAPAAGGLVDPALEAAMLAAASSHSEPR